MKCADFRTFLCQLSVGLSNAGAREAAVELEGLCVLLDAQPQKTVVSIVTKLKAQEDLKQTRTTQYALSNLKELGVWLETFGKPAPSKDFSAILGMLHSMQIGDLPHFVSQARLFLSPLPPPAVADPREGVVSSYCERLEAALGDDPRFSAVLEELSREDRVRTSELLLIAKRFGLASAKSRTAAVKKIRSRHQAVLTSQAKSNATGGRVAG